ncbi:MAG: hypothetical protein OXI77_06385 [Chloroflexota bacterium]|nr:hypothetical protein [Chloroflexota bacterium]MDE2909836.1 hypothetical protein [Chloroflexota bacterium]
MASTESAVKEPLSRQKRRRSAPIADEPTKAELMEDIRIGLQQAAAGEGRPAHETFAEIRRKIAGNAHSR